MGNNSKIVLNNKYSKLLINHDIDTLNIVVNDYFIEYFISRKIDILTEYKSIPTNIYNDSFLYIYSKVFKPDKYSYHYRSIIDTSNIYLVDDIYTLIFLPLCYRYDIKARFTFFTDMTGINSQTIYKWKNGNVTNIDDKSMIEEYKLLADKILYTKKGLILNTLVDTPVGQITTANNDAETGLEYNSKRVIESAAAQVLTVNDLNDKLKLLE